MALFSKVGKLISFGQKLIIIVCRTFGFRGRHICDVTLLHGPTSCDLKVKAPLILTSAAHCNTLCKTNQGKILEFCCCRDSEDQQSCMRVNYVWYFECLFLELLNFRPVPIALEIPPFNRHFQLIFK